MNSEVLKGIYLSNGGRLGRLAYFGYSLALFVAFAIVVSILTTVLGMVGLVLSFVLYLGLLYCQYNVAAKRFQDLNKPGQYALYMMGVAFIAGILTQVAALHLIGILLEILLLVVGLYLLFMPGTAGANNYGAAPTALPGVQ
ncbi:MAG TPA: DUF805 domain-containing protein [Dongiaceae bacterium]|nr:DUF805 domain-containing protein [Dongiaceae bacterium]